ncbi:hypothetical protein [Aquamicrobium soli]|jgi:hypothetical protein|uniref:Uncharacterized protein n=1 Tax=Aquamicrobium soli TaxID=1811518 RepID=A0ABV7KDF1_9HYPH
MNAPISKQVAEQAIFAAARWYVANRETIRQRQGRVVPELRNRFGLTPRQAKPFVMPTRPSRKDPDL